LAILPTTANAQSECVCLIRAIVSIGHRHQRSLLADGGKSRRVVPNDASGRDIFRKIKKIPLPRRSKLGFRPIYHVQQALP